MSHPALFGGPSQFTPWLATRHSLEPSLPVRAVSMAFGPTDPLIEIYERVPNPDDPFALRDIYLGRVEAAYGDRSSRPELAALWRSSRSRRAVNVEEILTSRATVRFVKEVFNHYFRDDLYGSLRRDDHLILSSGSVDEEEWGLPTIIKDCLTYALKRDWYGYSDSLGRETAREAIARYESARMPGTKYTLENVALTLGGTFAISSLADFILIGRTTTAPALCAIPNYPPLVESVARRESVRLVPTPLIDGVTSIAPLIAEVRPDTPLVLLQTVTNPTGTMVSERELEKLVLKAAPNTIIILDECHEFLGPPVQWSAARTASNVIRVSSLSKNWSAPGLKVGWILADSNFITDYYEYASSTFGGPPSLFYTAVEVLARMERWREEGLQVISSAHLAEFEANYGLTRSALQCAYASYVSERDARESALIHSRDIAEFRLNQPNSTVIAARYSINSAVALHDWDCSYLAFREILDQTRVSVFPGLLTFCLSEGLVRITTSRRRSELNVALDRIQRFLRSGVDQGFENGTTARA
jgi:aspartate/methionine/tyrosine aminotransferase